MHDGKMTNHFKKNDMINEELKNSKILHHGKYDESFC